MRLQPLYGVLAILGLVIPYYFFLGFLITNRLDIWLLIAQIFATDISTFFAADVILSAVAVLVFVITEGSNKRIPHLRVPVLGTLVVGPSFGLPCYLYLREGRT
jgi:hypothetical protein